MKPCLMRKSVAAPVSNRIRSLLAFALGGVIAMVAPPLQAHDSQPICSARLLTSASAFLSSLSPEQRQKAVFPLDDPERKDWSNLPHTLHPRKGISLSDLSPQQRVKAHHLFQAGLSSQGYLKASGIMQLDEVLLHLDGQAGSASPMFGLNLYWLSFLGEPSAQNPWGWQLDGHHLALNFAVVDHHVAMTPTFMGSDPHEVRDGPHAGWRVLGAEDDKGVALMKALNPEQQRQAMLSAAAPSDIITGPGRDRALQRFEGLTFSALNLTQQALLITMVEEYVHNYSHDLSHAHLDRIRTAGWDKVYFGWAGPTDSSAPYYYRVHGPALLIEFDNQYAPGRSDGPVNHIHSVFRDPQNDYGEDLLKQHYQQSHQRAKP
jgi:hypothetical protein